MNKSRSGNSSTAGVLVATGAISIQFGAAFATHLFRSVGPAGATALRVVFAALALLAFNWRKGFRLSKLRARRNDFLLALAFGIVLGTMNLTFYESIRRIPLGVAVTVEFVGPLAVTIFGSRRTSDLIWAFLAGFGVFLLAGGGVFSHIQHLDIVGVLYALAAGVCWIGYILLNSAAGKRFDGTTGLTIAMAAASIFILPFGLYGAGLHLLRPGLLATGFVVALLSSAIPYSLEMYALKRITPRAFGILLSLDPVFAALAGLVILHQRLDAYELTALILVMVANAGSAWFDSRRESVAVV